MSRKHFESIAASLANIRPINTNGEAYARWLASVNAIAGTCQALNPKFSRTAFLEACQGEEKDMPTCGVDSCARVATLGNLVCGSHFSFPVSHG